MRAGPDDQRAVDAAAEPGELGVGQRVNARRVGAGVLELERQRVAREAMAPVELQALVRHGVRDREAGKRRAVQVAGPSPEARAGVAPSTRTSGPPSAPVSSERRIDRSAVQVCSRPAGTPRAISSM